MFCLFCQLLDSWAHRFFRHSSFLKVQPAGISADLDSTSNDAGHSSPTRKSIHPPPAFGSSPNLEALALAASLSQDEDADNSVHNNSLYSRPLHEITFSTEDKPKLLFQLTALLAELGLNIQEAHAFSTTDGYSLDVFVVDGWPYEVLFPCSDPYPFIVILYRCSIEHKRVGMWL
jgi:hypothetical protein